METLYSVTWKNGYGSHEKVCCDNCYQHIVWAQPKPLNWLTTPAVRGEIVSVGDCPYCEYRKGSENRFERQNGMV